MSEQEKRIWASLLRQVELVDLQAIRHAWVAPGWREDKVPEDQQGPWEWMKDMAVLVGEEIGEREGG